VDDGLAAEILAAAARFAEEVIYPLDAPGDKSGASFKEGAVTLPAGWRDAYQGWCAGGWNGLGAPEAFGGQGLPATLAMAAQEIWNSASMAFAVGPMLTSGAIEALTRHATPELQALYLPKLVGGEWMATMNLTEPQAGSDLGALRTRAERHGDGTYRIFGQKIFITYGEHDLTENIVHLVLARLPDAPPGTKGISLFLVPRAVPQSDGSLVRNDVVCAGIEQKLGIHASPTCTMVYGEGSSGPRGGDGGAGEPGAIGWLIGEEHRGLACMFTMMNNARLAIGVQGTGVAERALQLAEAYARERRQGRASGVTDGEMQPIIVHPDIRRMLLTMRGLTAASRALCTACAAAIDRARAGDDVWRMRADLLTPVAKAFSTDAGFDVSSLGIQIHGGAGYIEETGAAQTLRDARIAPIYEGTNGIQAIDLVIRKLPLDNGAAFASYVDELRTIPIRLAAENRPELGRTAEKLAAALDDLGAAGKHLLAVMRESRTEEALAGATPFLRLFGLAAGSAYLGLGALVREEDGNERRTALARFFAERLLPETAALRETIVDGAAAIPAADTPVFAA
jgi:alkylation response protein AidB-like acyl-CoA dehydrogenase